MERDNPRVAHNPPKAVGTPSSENHLENTLAHTTWSFLLPFIIYIINSRKKSFPPIVRFSRDIFQSNGLWTDKWIPDPSCIGIELCGYCQFSSIPCETCNLKELCGMARILTYHTIIWHIMPFLCLLSTKCGSPSLRSGAHLILLPLYGGGSN